MRVTTAFNRILDLPGASVVTVSFADQGLIIGLRRRRRRLLCPCGRQTRSHYDSSRRRWRHLDFGACKVFLEAEGAPHRLPGVWAGVAPSRCVGQAGCAAHPRLRGRGGPVGAADGQDQRGPAAALHVGGPRPHRRPGRGRAHRRHPAGRAATHRGGRGVVQARPPVFDDRGRPRLRPCGVGRQGPQQSRPSKRCSTPSTRPAPAKWRRSVWTDPAST